MSDRKGIENLLAQSPSVSAPTPTDLRKRTNELAPPAEEQGTIKPERTAPQTRPKRSRKTSDNAPPDGAISTLAGFRFQVTASQGSSVAAALHEILTDVPKHLRHGINVGSLFRQVMIDYDEEIAAMIRKSIGEQDQ